MRMSQNCLSTEEKNRLAERYLSMVYIVAGDIRQRLPVNVDFDAMVSAGQWGLAQALESYETGRDTRFITYAKHRIRGAILDELRRIDPVGRSTRQRVRQLEEAQQALRSELGRNPESDELDRAVPLKPQQKLRAQQLPTVIPIDQIGVVQEMQQLADTLCGDAFDQASRNEFGAAIRIALLTLSERHQRIIRLCFLEDHTLTEMARALGILPSSAWRVRAEALDELRIAYVAGENAKRRLYAQAA